MPPSILYGQFVSKFRQVGSCPLFGLDSCLNSFDVFQQKHYKVFEEMSSDYNEEQWKVRRQSRLCLLCGSQDCLQSFKYATMKHSSIKSEMNKMSKLFPSYIVHPGKPVKSGLNFIFKKGINCMNATQSAYCTGLAFGTDLMCISCRHIFREPAVRSALR